ncbi:hypothetical protein PCAR4_200152 [Paraburkholderia caribensis]|nr:hypothetical protein PCAR4_200152 [Paraburkholderia caribensis]
MSLSGAQVGPVAGLPRVAREGPAGYQAWPRASVTITLAHCADVPSAAPHN